MKKIFLLIITTIFIISCVSKNDVNKKIKEKISAFYKHTEVKQYTPLSYSKLDTIRSTKLKTTATIKHIFKAEAKNGKIRLYTDIFDVTIFKDDVFAIPRGY
ncbi:hypothetical protein G1K66_08380 [Tenacibaculum finnmarkense]|uniref:hypothetical protein n=1 Tax=Tenacibaculum finnmarkense TaxID=2781243 RepID=UPI001EFA6A36|nr:hypothetical protein [Tenacibaculum finnmarkense]MCG8813276.1 hypothetical protein [Tenacibaculum finnmarkense]